MAPRELTPCDYVVECPATANNVGALTAIAQSAMTVRDRVGFDTAYSPQPETAACPKIANLPSARPFVPAEVTVQVLSSACATIELELSSQRIIFVEPSSLTRLHAYAAVLESETVANKVKAISLEIFISAPVDANETPTAVVVLKAVSSCIELQRRLFPRDSY